MSESVKALLHGKHPPLKKMTKQNLKMEVEMWRNIWDWIPSEIKYYVSRTGTLVGVNMRGPKRYVGPLLETHWILKEIEVGCFDKVYNMTEGGYFYERKVVKVPVGQIAAFSWIAERDSEDDFKAKAEAEVQEGGDSVE